MSKNIELNEEIVEDEIVEEIVEPEETTEEDRPTDTHIPFSTDLITTFNLDLTDLAMHCPLNSHEEREYKSYVRHLYHYNHYFRQIYEYCGKDVLEKLGQISTEMSEKSSNLYKIIENIKERANHFTTIF
jgi:hypothetical protein